jgi:prevent-host-death family protein
VDCPRNYETPGNSAVGGRATDVSRTQLNRQLDTAKEVILFWSYRQGIVMQKMAAAQFKARCLAVMDQVSQSGRPVVITKHGKPVVKLVPANEGEDEIFGALAGIARIKGDIEKTVPARDWGVE